jgi:hypothetical protein
MQGDERARSTQRVMHILRPETLGPPLRRRRAGASSHPRLRYQLNAECAEHLANGLKFRPRVAAERAIEVFPGYAGRLSNGGHTLRARYGADRLRD